MSVRTIGEVKGLPDDAKWIVAGKSAILCHAVEAVVAVLRAGVVTCEREEVRRIAVRHNNTNARTVTGVDGVGGVGQGYSTADAEVRR